MTTLQCTLPQWKHVPIYVETGKKYASKYSAIRIKSTFSDTPSAYNSIIYELYPEELLHIELVNRYPENKNTSPVLISNTSKISCHGDDCLPEYARLILHALTEQYASFLSIEEVKDAWKITQKLESLQKNSPLLVY